MTYVEAIHALVEQYVTGQVAAVQAVADDYQDQLTEADERIAALEAQGAKDAAIIADLRQQLADCQAPPADPAPARTVFALDGSAVNPSMGGQVSPSYEQDYADKSARFGDYNMPRPFFTGSQTLSWGNGQLASLHAGEVPVISKKIGSGSDYATLLAFFDALPDRLPQMWWCFHHEPRTSKPDVTPADYRAAWETAWKARAASKNASRIGLVKILMSYQTRFGGQKWADYITHPAGAVDPYCCDVVGIDAYNEAWTPEALANGGYEPPALSCQIAKTISDATGLPFALTEFGAMRQPATATTLQLAWDQGAYQWALDNGALWAGIWCDNDPRWVWVQKSDDPVSNWVRDSLAATKGIIVPIPHR